MTQEEQVKKPIKIFKTINSVDFPSKKSVEDHVRKIVERSPKTPLNALLRFDKKLNIDQVVFPTQEDEYFIKELGESNFDYYERKIGIRGLDRVFVSKNKDYPNTYCFYIIRKDGSFTDISWINCITPCSYSKLVKKAFRFAIWEQIFAFKDYIFGQGKEIRCPYTNELLTPKNSHIDHDPSRTFEDMYLEFFRCTGLKEDDVLLKPSKDMCSIKEILDDKIRDDWQKFHKHFCILRPLSVLGNTSHSKKEANEKKAQKNLN